MTTPRQRRSQRKSRVKVVSTFHGASVVTPPRNISPSVVVENRVDPNRKNNKYPSDTEASRFVRVSDLPNLGMFSHVDKNNRKGASFLTRGTVRETDSDSEREDIDSCVRIVPHCPRDAESCACVAQTSVDESSFYSSSSQSCTSAASSSSEFSKLSVGVHFADEIGLPVQFVHHYDRHGCPKRPSGKSNSNNNTPWDDPPCEPSNRWFEDS
mmetsp:Transcript_16780/g.38763  ORF Transcript_16780/g.38763 Transcript_16780/m.38763 type:complete len:212 (+) Transcript_16780:349-984(+)